MPQGRIICPQCSTELSRGARFCGECGTAVPDAAADKPLRGSHTILGLDAEAVRAAAALLDAAKAKAAAAAPAETSADPEGRGATSVEASATSAEQDSAPRAAPSAQDEAGAASEASVPQAQPAPEVAATPTAAEPPADDKSQPKLAPVQAPATSRRPLGHTILGLSASQLPAAAAARGGTSPGVLAAPAASTSPGAIAAPATSTSPGAIAAPGAAPQGPGSAAKRTLLGLQSSSGTVAAPADAAAALAKTQVEGQALADLLSSEAPTAPLPGVPDFNATRVEGRPGGSPRHATALGIGLPAAAPSGAPKSVQGRTMLGVPLSSLSPLPPAAETDPAVAANGGQTRATGSAWEPDARSTRSSEAGPERMSAAPGGGAARSRVALVLAGLALLSLVAMVYVRFSGRAKSADVSARIQTNQQGESLLFEVPHAAEGSKLRFGGQEQPLVAGRATFPLASDSLRVGDNIVLADVISPNGETASARIVLAVFYRIWVDTSALRADRPSLDVVVTAIPGTKVTLEGQEVQLDAQGRATKTYPLDVVHSGKGGVIDHVVHYRMQPPKGETVVDELHTRIPVAMMQIDRPGPDIVTDRESVEIAGAVGRDTQVSIDGTQVPVKDGRFLHRLALPRPGDYKPRVIATAAGKAPLGVTLSIKRVRDIAQAAREFTFDKSLSYAKIAPNPTIYKGQNIAIEGRVYAVDARSGSSVLQMLARPCPSTQRCSLWVVDPQAAEVSVDRWVRVLGVVDGEQQFRSEKNEIVTVPKIIARFVLPSKP